MKANISLKNLSFCYHGRDSLLENVSFEVEKGEFIGLVGPNGAGKTTLLKLLMGFLNATQGSLTIEGKKPSSVRSKIGYVPQVHRIDPAFPITVKELIAMGGMENRLFYPKSKTALIETLLEEFDLKQYAKAPFASLSGGQAQKALFARALLADPDYLFLDEPTANIDPVSSKFIYEKLSQLKRKKTILLITHDLQTAIRRVDRIFLVQRTVTSLSPQEVCEHFALGLYHTPLLDLPENHFVGEHVASCPVS